MVAVAEGTRVTAATPKGDNDVVADSTSYPFYSYSALGFWTAANRGQDATHADTPAQGIIAATHIPCVDTTLRPSIASAPTTRADLVHGKGAIQHRVPLLRSVGLRSHAAGRTKRVCD